MAAHFIKLFTFNMNQLAAFAAFQVIMLLTALAAELIASDFAVIADEAANSALLNKAIQMAVNRCLAELCAAARQACFKLRRSEMAV